MLAGIVWTLVSIGFFFLVYLLFCVLRCISPIEDEIITEVRITMAKTVIEGGVLPVEVKFYNSRGRQIDLPEGATLDIVSLDELVGTIEAGASAVDANFKAEAPGTTNVVATLHQDGKDDLAGTSEAIEVLVDDAVATVEVLIGE